MSIIPCIRSRNLRFYIILYTTPFLKVIRGTLPGWPYIKTIYKRVQFWWLTTEDFNINVRLLPIDYNTHT